MRSCSVLGLVFTLSISSVEVGDAKIAAGF